MKHFAIVTVITALSVFVASPALSFCGFYVSGSGESLFNDATRAAMMRHGKRTVLTMQNKYAGPPEDFAMVVPVPMVLEKKNVKTVSNGLFDRLDALSAPRLVEYWERDPCAYTKENKKFYDFSGQQVDGSLMKPAGAGAKNVQVEAEYKVGEYDVVVLSSDASTALEDWLREHDYNIPAGAAPYFRPYVQKGQYFFVAKVDIDRVEYEDGEAVLSPLRFYYDNDDFSLPVRLGLINSKGAQDLIVYILAPGQRYEVANYPNVTIPTNIGVKEDVKTRFADFYRALFDQVLKENPQAVVTEYAWPTGKCDPCPAGAGNGLSFRDLNLLGLDALADAESREEPVRQPLSWTLTRLHTRYAKTSLGEDLVFEPAPPISGGRGMPGQTDGALPDGEASPSDVNNFQARYIIRHFWDGPIDCERPLRGHWWGSPPSEAEQSRDPHAAGDIGFSEGDPVAIASYIDGSGPVAGLDEPLDSYTEPAKDVVASWGELVDEPTLPESSEPDRDSRGGCASSGCGGQGTGSAAFFVILAVAVGGRLRRRPNE